MSDPIDENIEHDPTDEQAQPNEPTPSDDPLQGLKERATDLLKGGVTEARESLENQIPELQQDLSKALSEASYGIGYAVKFASTLLKEFAPEDVNSGYEKGADAGGKAAEVVVNDRQEREQTPHSDMPKEPEPGSV